MSTPGVRSSGRNRRPTKFFADYTPDSNLTTQNSESTKKSHKKRKKKAAKLSKTKPDYLGDDDSTDEYDHESELNDGAEDDFISEDEDWLKSVQRKKKKCEVVSATFYEYDWLEEDQTIPCLMLPPGATDLLIPVELSFRAVAVYEVIRRFHISLRLTPFRFEDFCSALSATYHDIITTSTNEQVLPRLRSGRESDGGKPLGKSSDLLSEVHMALLRAVLRDEEATNTIFGPRDTRDSIILSITCALDSLTWFEALRLYVDSLPKQSDLYGCFVSVQNLKEILLAVNFEGYHQVPIGNRIQILELLCSRFLESAAVRNALSGNSFNKGSMKGSNPAEGITGAVKTWGEVAPLGWGEPKAKKAKGSRKSTAEEEVGWDEGEGEGELEEGVADLTAEHEDKCRGCNKGGELVCCEGCPAVFHLWCAVPALKAVPEGEWWCDVCRRHLVEGVNDILLPHESMSMFLRQEPLGYDRHNRSYWILARRLFVSKEGGEILYYSTSCQLDAVIQSLDRNHCMEAELISALEERRDVIGQMMSVTVVLTNDVRGKRPSVLDQDDEEVSDWLQQKISGSCKQTNNTDAVKQSTTNPVHSISMEKPSATADIEKMGNTDENFTKEHSNESDSVEKKMDAGDCSSTGKTECDTKNSNSLTEFENYLFGKGDSKPKSDNTETNSKCKTVSGTSRQTRQTGIKTASAQKDTKEQESKVFKLGMEGGWKRYQNQYSIDPHRTLSKIQKAEEKDPKRYLSTKFCLEAILELNTMFEACSWWDSACSLANDIKTRFFSNCSTKYSGYKSGGKVEVGNSVPVLPKVGKPLWELPKEVKILRDEMIELCNELPVQLVHRGWAAHVAQWMEAVRLCETAQEFALALGLLDACIKPVAFCPAWSDGLGFVRLRRTETWERDEWKKLEKDLLQKSRQTDELSLLMEANVKYSFNIRHQVWKQRGEDYRLTGGGGWSWVSSTRRSVSCGSPALLTQTLVTSIKTPSVISSSADTIRNLNNDFNGVKEITSTDFAEKSVKSSRSRKGREGRKKRKSDVGSVKQETSVNEQSKDDGNKSEDKLEEGKEVKSESMETSAVKDSLGSVSNAADDIKIRRKRLNVLHGLLGRREKQHAQDMKLMVSFRMALDMYDRALQQESKRAWAAIGQSSGQSHSCYSVLCRKECLNAGGELTGCYSPSCAMNTRNVSATFDLTKDGVEKKKDCGRVSEVTKELYQVKGKEGSSRLEGKSDLDRMGAEVEKLDQSVINKKDTSPNKQLASSRENIFESIMETSPKLRGKFTSEASASSVVNGVEFSSLGNCKKNEDDDEGFSELHDNTVSRNQALSGLNHSKLTEDCNLSKPNKASSLDVNKELSQSKLDCTSIPDVNKEFSQSKLDSMNRIKPVSEEDQMKYSHVNIAASLKDLISDKKINVTADLAKEIRIKISMIDSTQFISKIMPKSKHRGQKAGLNNSDIVGKDLNKSVSDSYTKLGNGTNSALMEKCTESTGFKCDKLTNQKSDSKEAPPSLPVDHRFLSVNGQFSVFTLCKAELRKLSLRGGRYQVGGFSYTSGGIDAAGEWWPYPAPRPKMKTAWRYRLHTARNLACVIMQLRILRSCIRWRDIALARDGAAVAASSENGRVSDQKSQYGYTRGDYDYNYDDDDEKSVDDDDEDDYIRKERDSRRVEVVGCRLGRGGEEYLVRTTVKTVGALGASASEELCNQELESTSGPGRVGRRERKALMTTVAMTTSQEFSTEDWVTEEDLGLRKLFEYHYREEQKRIEESRCQSVSRAAAISRSRSSNHQLLKKRHAAGKVKGAAAHSLTNQDTEEEELKRKKQLMQEQRLSTKGGKNPGNIVYGENPSDDIMEVEEKGRQKNSQQFSRMLNDRLKASYMKWRGAENKIPSEIPSPLKLPTLSPIGSKTPINTCKKTLKQVDSFSMTDSQNSATNMVEKSLSGPPVGSSIKSSPFCKTDAKPVSLQACNADGSLPSSPWKRPTVVESVANNSPEKPPSDKNQTQSVRIVPGADGVIRIYGLKSNQKVVKLPDGRLKIVTDTSGNTATSSTSASIPGTVSAVVQSQPVSKTLNQSEPVSKTLLQSLPVLKTLNQSQPVSDTLNQSQPVSTTSSTTSQSSSVNSTPMTEPGARPSSQTAIPTSSNETSISNGPSNSSSSDKVMSSNSVSDDFLTEFEDYCNSRPTSSAAKSSDNHPTETLKRGATSIDEAVAEEPTRKQNKISEGDGITAESQEMSEETEEELHCVCLTRYNDAELYIQCDTCEGWYHGSCVHVSPEDVANMTSVYICPGCDENYSNRLLATVSRQPQTSHYSNMTDLVKNLQMSSLTVSAFCVKRASTRSADKSTLSFDFNYNLFTDGLMKVEEKLSSHSYTSTSAMLDDILHVGHCLDFSQGRGKDTRLERSRLKTYMLIKADELFCSR